MVEGKSGHWGGRLGDGLLREVALRPDGGVELWGRIGERSRLKVRGDTGGWRQRQRERLLRE